MGDHLILSESWPTLVTMPVYGTDCDDTDPNIGSILYDNDCDGVLTADDCDDNDNTDASLSGDCDGDGVPVADDCDDTDAAVTNFTYFRDADSDTYGDASNTTTGCTVPAGFVEVSGDCDDTRSDVNPPRPFVSL